jgi:hypothetical protein
MDKQAVKILFKTYWSSEGWKSVKELSDGDFEYAKSKKVMFDPILIDHRQTIEWLLKSYAQTSKDHVVKCFMSSLSARRLEIRSGLSSYAFARNFPMHDFLKNNDIFCKICGLYNLEKQEEDLNVFNFERIKWGGVRLTDPVYVAWNLEIFNNELTPEPSIEDICIFNKIISTIYECDSKDRPTQLEKRLSLILKSSSNERRIIIDMFGICGILETKNHKGFFDSYIPTQNRANRPVNKTDWEYPVDWWTGKDGINKDALNFYFADYLK